MLLFMAISIAFPYSPVNDNLWIRFASRIALLPLIAGLSYEVSVRWAGRRDNIFVKIVIAPGMLMQRLTTKEPDEQQIEVAVTALARVLEQEDDNWKMEEPTPDEAAK
jgi:uncharacterized protein YqhQ